MTDRPSLEQARPLARRADSGGAIRRRIARALLLASVALGLCETISVISLHLVRVHTGFHYRRLDRFFDPEDVKSLKDFLRTGEGWYFRHDPDLGWTTRPSTVNTTPATQNAQGVRSLHLYPETPVPGTVRIAAFGDSFVHGDEVVDGDEWASVVEHSAPDLEVMNFGVSGYGPDQAFLRWRRDGVSYRPNIVIAGYMSENLNRTINVFRPFYEKKSGFRLAKPRFRLDGGDLVLLPNPMPSPAAYVRLLEDPDRTLSDLGRHDDFFQGSGWADSRLRFSATARLVAMLPRILRSSRLDFDRSYDRGSEAYRTAHAVLVKLCESARSAGAVPIVVVFPTKPDIDEHRAQRPAPYRLLVDDLRSEGWRTVDLMHSFDELGSAIPSKDLFVLYHYSKAGNRIAAAGIMDEIEKVRLGDFADHGRVLASPPMSPATIYASVSPETRLPVTPE